MTLFKNLNIKTFAKGQAYVALTGVKSLAGFYVIKFTPKSMWTNHDVIAENNETFENFLCYLLKFYLFIYSIITEQSKKCVSNWYNEQKILHMYIKNTFCGVLFSILFFFILKIDA